MRNTKYIVAIVISLLCVCGSINTVNAAEEVKPVVKYDFESVNGTSVTNSGTNTSIGAAEIIGSGNVIYDTERGYVFYNHAANEYDRTVRTNYLKLDSNIFKDAITGSGMTVSMWMKFDPYKVDINSDHAFRWADIFVAYDSGNHRKLPMMKLGVNLIGRINNTTDNDSAFFDTIDMGSYLADNKWHYIIFTVSTSKTAIYIDGKEVSTISLDGSWGRNVGNFFTSGKNSIDTICVAGNSLWNDDSDMCALFDDVCIYDVALTKEQIAGSSGIIDKGVSFDDVSITAGKAINYTIDTNVINTSDIQSYAWYVGDELASTSSAAYIPIASDAEKTITLKITMKDKSYTECHAYYSIFPVLYIDSDISYGNVPREYIDVNFNLTGKDYTAEQLYNGIAKIKLRGNSTAGLAKQPYKIKLDSKTDIFGFGKSKHWVLLANAIDVSLVRNKLLQGFAGDLGLDYMESELVTLVYNGQYQGVYELSEHVRIGSSRVDIFEWEDLAEDAAKAIAKDLRANGVITEEQYDEVKDNLEDELASDYSWVDSSTHSFTSKYLKGLGKTATYDISEYLDFSTEVPSPTGGVLLEMDFWYQIQENKLPNVMTAYAMPIYTNTPDSLEVKFDTLVKYIDTYVQAMEYSLHSTDFVFKNSDVHYAVDSQGYYDGSKRVGVTYKVESFTNNEYNGWHYTDFLDIDSAINNMLVCEVSLNWDCMKNSFFMYKDIDGKMIFGPVWDFDWAWGNSMGQDTNAPETWQTTNEWFANEQFYQTVQWNRLLIRDPYFIVKLYERYHEIRDAYLEPLVNSSVAEMRTNNTLAGMANDARWKTAFSATAGQNYTEQLDNIQTFLDRRLVWLDAQFTSIDTLMDSLNYYVRSDEISVDSCDTTSEDGYTIVTVGVTHKDVKKVSIQVNGKSFYTGDVVNNVATIKVPDKALVSDGSLNVVQARGQNADGTYVINNSGTIKGNYYNAVSNYATFTKDVSASDSVVDSDNKGTTVDGVDNSELIGEEPTTSVEDETEDETKKDNTANNEKESDINNNYASGSENTQNNNSSDSKNNADNSLAIWLVTGILVIGAVVSVAILVLKKYKLLGN